MNLDAIRQFLFDPKNPAFSGTERLRMLNVKPIHYMGQHRGHSRQVKVVIELEVDGLPDASKPGDDYAI